MRQKEYHMKQESNEKPENERHFDTFNEPRTIPGHWDVSAFHTQEKSPDSDQFNDEHQSKEASHTENGNEVKKSEPSGIKYLDPEYDNQRTNRKWPSY
jgi:NADH:ubiquinone oxidoreductase subunit